jgi:hypothetical protein
MSDNPILSQKYYEKSSVFQPENLLREARRQKEITELLISEVTDVSVPAGSKQSLRFKNLGLFIFILNTDRRIPKMSINQYHLNQRIQIIIESFEVDDTHLIQLGSHF